MQISTLPKPTIEHNTFRYTTTYSPTDTKYQISAHRWYRTRIKEKNVSYILRQILLYRRLYSVIISDYAVWICHYSTITNNYISLKVSIEFVLIVLDRYVTSHLNLYFVVSHYNPAWSSMSWFVCTLSLPFLYIYLRLCWHHGVLGIFCVFFHCSRETKWSSLFSYSRTHPSLPFCVYTPSCSYVL